MHKHTYSVHQVRVRQANIEPYNQHWCSRLVLL